MNSAIIIKIISLKSSRLLRGSVFISLFILLIVNSCKKDPYQIGLSLLPPTDTLSVKSTDTTTVIAYSVLQDSIRTDKATTNILGSLVDPVFGKTTASFCSQIRLSTEKVSFGLEPVLDSIVLMLRYSSIYGDANSMQNVKVYELEESLNPDSAYYSNHVVHHYPILLANKSFLPALKDSVKIFKSKFAPHLRINLSKLTSYFGNKLLYAPEDVLLNNTNFIKFLKGLYVETSPLSANGGLISFDMGSALTKVVLYFKNHDTAGKVVDSLSYDFVINSSCARFNIFDHHQYLEASPEFKNQVLNHDTSSGKNMLFLQGLGGVKIRFRLPNIKDYV